MAFIDYVMHSRTCSAFKTNTDILKELLSLYCRYVKETSKARAKLDKDVMELFKKHGISVNPPAF